MTGLRFLAVRRALGSSISQGSSADAFFRMNATVTVNAAASSSVNATINSPSGRYCAAANEQARSEHREFTRYRYITKPVMCDVSPHCVTELMFSQEFWWDPRTSSLSGTNRMRPLKVSLQYRRAGGARVAAAAHPVSRCRSWKEEDWPTWEPHLSRSTQVPRPRDFWDIAQLLPNKTIWLHGDSITLQMCDAAFCSLMRTGVAPAPLFGLPRQRPLWLRRAEADSTYNFLSTVLPNGARIMCSGIGLFQQGKVEKVLPMVDVAVLNL